MEIKDLLFASLRSEILGDEAAKETVSALDFDSAASVLHLAQKHDLGHIVAAALMHGGILDAEKTPQSTEVLDAEEVQTQEKKRKALRQACERLQMTAVLRYERLCFALNEIAGVLSEAKIAFLPLKGAVIRKYYPEAWMRTSCDIDILVRFEDLEEAILALVEKKGYTRQGMGTHDISLFSQSGIHLELHYDLIEEGRENRVSSVLSSVWETAVLKEGFSYWYEMPDEMFYFYHMAHMAKHFKAGGCGIRPFMDLFLLENIKNADASRRDALLLQGGLLKFAEAARRLCNAWFGGIAYDELTQQVEDYVLQGGVYGSTGNLVRMRRWHVGKLRYALSRIFPSRRALANTYPILHKHAWLLPVMQVRRWFRLVFRGHLRRGVRELRHNQKISSSKTQSFLDSLGL